MTFQTTRQFSTSNTPAGAEAFIAWRDIIIPSIGILRQMAGTTEDEFLQIGSEIQGFYQRSRDITQMSSQLVQVVSGESVHGLTGRLQQMMTDMESYLSEARTRSSDSCNTLELVQDF